MFQLFRHSGMDRRNPDCRDAAKPIHTRQLKKRINHGKHGRQGKTTLYFRVVRVFCGFSLFIFFNQWLMLLSWRIWPPNPAVHGAWIPAIHAGMTAFWV